MSSAARDLEPIVHRYRLRSTPERAFQTYVERIGEWWHPDYTASRQTFSGVVIDPKVGGPIRATFRDRDDDVWGHVTTWSPPHRLVHSFMLAQPPEAPSEVSVSFTPLDAGCEMTFVHGGWTPDNAALRGKFTDWPLILDRFVALLEDGASSPP